MRDQYRNPYLDSSIFIAWLKGEVGRHDIATHILTLAEQQVFKINVSALTLAEVHKKRNHPPLTTEEDEMILTYFEHDFINIIDIDRNMGEQANRFCRQFAILPADALHLACALRARCDVLLTWDNRLLTLKHPDISIEAPQKIGQLSLLNI